MATLVTGHLTDVHGEMSPKLKATQLGMAHIAGTGPFGMTCRECKMWGVPYPDNGEERPYRWRPKKEGGMLYGRRCLKFKQLMLASLTEAAGKHVPANTDACRHFVENDNPPPLVRE